VALPTLHIYPAYGPGWGTPRVYAITVHDGETLGESLSRYAESQSLRPMPRDALFAVVYKEPLRSKFEDVVMHQDILHPAL